MNEHFHTLTYALVPAFAILLAITGLSRRKSTAGFAEMFQNLGTGAVSAVVIVKLLPDVFRRHRSLGVLTGIALGIIVILIIKYFLDKKIEAIEQAETKNSLLKTVLLTIIVQLLIDAHALAIGLWFGKTEGILLSLAMSLETYSLGVMIIRSHKAVGVSKGRCTVSLVLFTLLFIFTTTLVFLTISHLSETLTSVILPAGVALLITRILLTEVPEGKAFVRQASFLIVGFIIFLLAALFIPV